ncbi:MAG: isochorismatase [Prochloraceae cyanobacterium]|nr:isochorismatase [Prochloraceae cyanobacterium]
MTPVKQLTIPEFFDPKKVSLVWRVPYQKRAVEAKAWAKKHQIQPADRDKIRTSLLLIDVQNTFCLPEFELFVGGESGTGAVDDNVRLCQFIYRNLAVITEICATMDTHKGMQIFHPLFWINEAGENPEPHTIISLNEVREGVWKVNPAVVSNLEDRDYLALQNYALHYVKKLTEDSKYPLTIWPYHSMLGGIGHALVSAVEEAVFFHNIARNSQTNFEIKGDNPLTENYSVLRSEVLEGVDGEAIGEKNTRLLDKLLSFDAIIIAGQAKSHCVAWTIDDLLTEILARDPKLAQKVYLLEDCTSPVVVPGAIDFSEIANAAFKRFADAGMHIVKSRDAIASWLNYK